MAVTEPRFPEAEARRKISLESRNPRGWGYGQQGISVHPGTQRAGQERSRARAGKSSGWRLPAAARWPDRKSSWLL